MEYICHHCGSKYPKWVGRCNKCGLWETISEHTEPQLDNRGKWLASNEQAVDLATIEQASAKDRWITEVGEFDQVVGGGFVPSSVGLLGGEPGVGKSTLILQLLGRLMGIGKRCLYISGEESLNQIKARADRLAVKQDGVMVGVISELDRIFELIEKIEPDFVIIDSIQTIYSSKLTQAAGSLFQIRECAALITQYAKGRGCSFLMVAHVTKDGHIAGPKTIEHIVDYVLYLEGAASENYRFLRAVKNRFGNINELGFFKMTAKGLSEVHHPNKIFLANWKGAKSGSIIFPASEGSRVMLVEIQALVSHHSSNYPSRVTLGIERNRLLILIAILEKQLKINLSNQDIYVNIANSIKVTDPAVDMAIIGAIYSSIKNIVINQPLAMLGELNLSGNFIEARNSRDKINTLEQSGIKHCIFTANKNVKTKFSGYTNIKNVKELVTAFKDFN